MRLTIESILALGPCRDYSPDRLRALFGGRRWVSHRTALRDRRVPAVDRVWLGIALLDERRKRLFACDCAEWALTREREAGREPDQRSWAAVEVSRRYADGRATDEALAAAWAAARAAWAARVAWAARDAEAAAGEWQIERLVRWIEGGE